jgi:hypothetical protein
MAYTIVRSGGGIITVQDGTLNTQTSVSLPGRNYAGYGQAVDTNFVRLLENFAASTPPANPLRGQLWYNTTLNTMHICPNDGNTTASAWPTLALTSSAGTTTLSDLNAGNITLPNGNIIVSNGKVDVTGNIFGTNCFITSNANADIINVRVINTSGLGNGINTPAISAGSTSTAGTLTGRWTVSGTGNALTVSTGNVAFSSTSVGIKCDKYMYGDGTEVSFSGTYTNANVSDFLTGANSVTQFSGNIAPTKVTTSYLAGGGLISGQWTLDTGARIEATYADLAERYEADAVYAVGTVVELGGEKEVTAVKDDLSENVFGVVSNTAAYLMNGPAGTDESHPAIALVGRVKVNVVGKVNKNDRLVSAGNGKARAGTKEELTPFNTIGRSLETKLDDSEGLIEAVVVIK